MAKRFTYYGNSFDADAQAFIDAAGITGETQKSVVNTFVLMLKGVGTTNGSNLFSKYHCLYPYCPVDETTANSTACSKNIINPSLYSMTFSSFVSGDFTPTGVTGGSGKFAFNGLIPSGVISQNNYGIVAVSASAGPQGIYNATGVWDTGGAANGINSLLYYSNGVTLGVHSRVNSTNQLATTSGTGLGLFVIQRTASNLVQHFRDNVSLGTGTAISTGVASSYGLYFHALNIAGTAFWNDVKKYTMIGHRQSFNANELADEKEAFDYFNANIISGGR